MIKHLHAAVRACFRVIRNIAITFGTFDESHTCFSDRPDDSNPDR